ncbi:hypothetical protein ACFWIX_11225 [Pseudarthrobacter sp. NPDC058362]|uniref:hypothetical protein n=1 Tax=Pseudarthrobacter sp. NPDC058362 TaxID=3346458 RepID=UPI0036675BB4
MEEQNPRQRRQSPPLPRWVKISLIVMAGLAVLAGVALLSGHGPVQHGPAMHGSAAHGLAINGSAARWL